MTTIIEDHNISTTAAAVDPTRTEALVERTARLVHPRHRAAHRRARPPARALRGARRSRGPITAAELADRRRPSLRGTPASGWTSRPPPGFLDVDGSDRRRRAHASRCRPSTSAVLLATDNPAHLVGAGTAAAGRRAARCPPWPTRTPPAAGSSTPPSATSCASASPTLNRPGFIDRHRAAGSSRCPTSRTGSTRGGIVLDAGCGEGWSSIGLAQAFPNAPSSASTSTSSRSRPPGTTWPRPASADRVTIAARQRRRRGRAAGGDRRTRSTLVTVFQALHDMGRPARRPGGVPRGCSPTAARSWSATSTVRTELVAPAERTSG